jgi:hypothetical protein
MPVVCEAATPALERQIMAEDGISVSDAALKLGVSYWRARDMLLRGDLQGGKDERGRYYVDQTSLNRMRKRQRAAASNGSRS